MRSCAPLLSKRERERETETERERNDSIPTWNLLGSPILLAGTVFPPNSAYRLIFYTEKNKGINYSICQLIINWLLLLNIQTFFSLLLPSFPANTPTKKFQNKHEPNVTLNFSRKKSTNNTYSLPCLCCFCRIPFLYRVKLKGYVSSSSDKEPNMKTGFITVMHNSKKNFFLLIRLYKDIWNSLTRRPPPQ